MKAWVRRLLEWAGRVGTDSADSPETLLQKRLTVALCVGTLPLTIGWSLMAAGAPAAAAIPAFYSLFTPLNTALFAWTRIVFGFYRFTQLLFTILVLPFLVMLALGGYRQSTP